MIDTVIFNPSWVLFVTECVTEYVTEYVIGKMLPKDFYTILKLVLDIFFYPFHAITLLRID